jgi:hypothetical protein
MIQKLRLANAALLVAAISLLSAGMRGAMAQESAADANAIAEMFTAPAMTVDFCEVDRTGSVHVGGKVGPDSKLGQPVFVSRGATQLEVLTPVNSNGTFEGTTGGSSLKAGDVVTVSIRPKKGKGANLVQCTLLPPSS